VAVIYFELLKERKQLDEQADEYHIAQNGDVNGIVA
jgi:hypothetical protein